MVREATAEDATAICDVLKRSILELCIADHRDDPALLARWLRNKTPESITSEMTQPGNSMLIAVEAGVILGVGLVDDTGEIHLNYVSPDARFRGISREVMRVLETRARERGSTRCTLTSTETARRFYLSGGYVEESKLPPRFPGDFPRYQMLKLLTTGSAKP